MKDMPRYIDISKVTIPEGFFDDLTVPKLLAWLKNQPSAEVVPKSEADKTIADWAYLYGDTLNKLETAKVEAAREIFSEVKKVIRRYLNDAGYSVGEMIYDIDVLEDKYVIEKSYRHSAAIVTEFHKIGGDKNRTT